MTAATLVALFGVYGLLGIGLMLFCLRGLFPRHAWSDRPLAWTFWLLNGGLAMMVVMSLFPTGAVQAWASISEGLWYARSAEMMQSELVRLFVWLRVPGDIVFSAGAVALAVFAAGLVLRSRRGAGTGPRVSSATSAPKKRGPVGPDLKDDKVLLAIQQRAAAAKLAQEKEAREKDAKAERDKAHIKKADKALKEDKAK